MLTKQQIIDALYAFARQKPGIEPGNYGSWRDYRNESASVTRDLTIARRLIRDCELSDSITAERMLEGFRAFSGRLSIDAVREAECSCKHKWSHKVELSVHTANLSGEASAYCPKCGKRAMMLSPIKARISYCTGQYFPTEFRKAVAAVCADVLWNWKRDLCMPEGELVHNSETGETFKRYQGLRAGDWIRRSFRREYGAGIARRYFD